MKNRFVSLVAAVGVVVTAPAVKAQHYPNRNVTMIVPYPAGGPTDETARIVAQSLSNQLKQSFIVEDIGGGGSIIGSEKVARATPDGYTLLVHNLQISANVTLYKALPFDTLKAFAPVMLINRNPLILVGRNTLAPSRLKDLVSLMKQEPMKAAIPGYGTTGHLATTLFAQEAGTDERRLFGGPAIEPAQNVDEDGDGDGNTDQPKQHFPQSIRTHISLHSFSRTRRRPVGFQCCHLGRSVLQRFTRA